MTLTTTKQSMTPAATVLLFSAMYISYRAVHHLYLWWLVSADLLFICGIFVYQRRLAQRPFDPPSIVLENSRDAK